MHACTQACTHTHTHTHVCTCTETHYTHTHTGTHTCTRVRTHTYTQTMQACTHTLSLYCVHFFSDWCPGSSTPTDPAEVMMRSWLVEHLPTSDWSTSSWASQDLAPSTYPVVKRSVAMLPPGDVTLLAMSGSLAPLPSSPCFLNLFFNKNTDFIHERCQPRIFCLQKLNVSAVVLHVFYCSWIS